MLSVTLARLALGLALGGGAALWWASRRPRTNPQAKSSSDIRARRHPAPQWHSDHRPKRNGRIQDGALVDAAVEDTFPASDPPAFMQSVIAGTPAHEQHAGESEEEIAEAHPS